MADHAVVIGISRYPDLGNLQGPEHDAFDFANWLENEAPDPVPKENIRLVLSSTFNELRKPTRQQVDEAFDDVLSQPLGPNGVVSNRLYIFMAGHGFAPNLEDAALLMANAARGKSGYHIPGRPYANWFRRARRFDEVVLFMDCCRENHSRAPINTPPWDEQTSQAPARRCYGFATEWSRVSREAPVGPAQTMRGKFTVALLEGLRGAAAHPQTKQITGATLSEFVYNTLTKQTGPNDELQEPKFDVDKNNDIVFVEQVSPPFTIRVAHSAADAARVSLQDGTFTALAPHAQQANTTEWKVYRGLYVLTRADGTSQVLNVTGPEEVIDV